ncbi:MAG TPA: type II secretion system protein GspL [Rhodanobacteraceae bacterium]|nr:type II secretion system protein GspL [Rhodanobacteraceae bacterium]
MPIRLLLRLTTDGSLDWLAPATRARGRAAPPPDLLANAGEVVVLVPSEDVLLTTANLPRSSAAKLARVLPFALEDQVLSPVEDLHFALGTVDDAGRHGVAVVAKAAMDGWLARLRSAGVQADILLPDCLAVPQRDAAPALLLEDQRVLLRLGVQQGTACAAADVAAWLPATRRGHAIDALAAVGAERNALGAELALNWHADDAESRGSATLDWLAQGVGVVPAINLLCGDYAPRHRRAPQHRLWRLAALFALAAIGIGLIGHVVEVVRLGQASRAADKAIQTLFAESFPSAPLVPDPVARMQSELKRLGGSQQGGGLMPLLTRIAPLLVSQDHRLRLDGLEYRNDALELSLHAPTLAILDQLRERLATLDGVHAELATASPDADGIDGRLRVQEGSP